MEKQSEPSEDHGEWLDVRVRHHKTSVPVRISRHALEEHFEAPSGQRNLIFLYVNNKELIHRVASGKMISGARYTDESPLELRSADFASDRGATVAGTRAERPKDLQRALDDVARSDQPSESAIGNYVHWKAEAGRVELTGDFSAEQLERIASLLRQALNDPPCANMNKEEAPPD